jgi:hypothetical protein
MIGDRLSDRLAIERSASVRLCRNAGRQLCELDQRSTCARIGNTNFVKNIGSIGRARVDQARQVTLGNLQQIGQARQTNKRLARLDRPNQAPALLKLKELEQLSRMLKRLTDFGTDRTVKAVANTEIPLAPSNPASHRLGTVGLQQP